MTAADDPRGSAFESAPPHDPAVTPISLRSEYSEVDLAPPRICPGCLKEHRPQRDARLYCSETCRDRAKKRRRYHGDERPPRPATTTCQSCGREIPQRPLGRPPLRCEPCRLALTRAVREPVACRGCSTVFVPRGTQRWCSKRCADRGRYHGRPSRALPWWLRTWRRWRWRRQTR